jgi:hypothetical protein
MVNFILMGCPFQKILLTLDAGSETGSKAKLLTLEVCRCDFCKLIFRFLISSFCSVVISSLSTGASCVNVSVVCRLFSGSISCRFELNRTAGPCAGSVDAAPASLVGMGARFFSMPVCWPV